MERAPSPEQEPELAPDLLGLYADKQATIFGMTATFDQLSKMCPIDLNDPGVSLESKNDFVIKAANESGLEVAAEHEELFSQRLETLGLERKFSVEPEPIQQPERDIVADKADTRHPRAVDRATIDRAHREQKQAAEIANNSDIYAAIEQQVRAQQEFEKNIQITEPTLGQPGKNRIEDPAAQTRASKQHEHSPVAPTAVAVQRAGEQRLQAVTEQVDLASEKSSNEQVELVQGLIIDVHTMDESYAGVELERTEMVELPAVPTEHLIENTSIQKIDALEALLHQEPTEIYEGFAHALELYGEQPTAAEDEQPQPAPEIVATITERLAELSDEEKEPVAEAMQDVIGALHGLQVMEARGADPLMIAAVEEQLAQLCVVLFEELAIEYTEQDIAMFVAVLRDPRFMPEAVMEHSVDLKDLGTHEIKYYARMAGSSSNVAGTMYSVLGTFVLNVFGVHRKADAA